MDLTVIGAGYVGAVTAASLAARGHAVRVLESNPDKAAILGQGVVPFHEPGLGDLFGEATRTGRLSATTDAKTALDGSELALVCVGTPLDDEGRADLSQLRAACLA